MQLACKSTKLSVNPRRLTNRQILDANSRLTSFKYQKSLASGSELSALVYMPAGLVIGRVLETRI